MDNTHEEDVLEQLREEMDGPLVGLSKLESTTDWVLWLAENSNQQKK